jgi:hypothetical protein
MERRRLAGMKPAFLSHDRKIKSAHHPTLKSSCFFVPFVVKNRFAHGLTGEINEKGTRES